jgi:deoxyribonuclease (pyrimidine dimer)
MTRINAGIKPIHLCNKHLLAEHREIKRIPNVLSNKPHLLESIDDIPTEFTLGKGHVRFFYDKLGYLHSRYFAIYEECKRRGFNVEFYGEAFDRYQGTRLYNDYQPTLNGIILISARINERLGLDRVGSCDWHTIIDENE